MIKYWHRLENLGNSFPLLQKAYNDSKLLYESKFPSWFGSLKTLLNELSGLEDHCTSSQYSFKTQCKHII